MMYHHLPRYFDKNLSKVQRYLQKTIISASGDGAFRSKLRDGCESGNKQKRNEGKATTCKTGSAQK